eukprot:gene4406-3205_t
MTFIARKERSPLMLASQLMLYHFFSLEEFDLSVGFLARHRAVLLSMSADTIFAEVSPTRLVPTEQDLHLYERSMSPCIAGSDQSCEQSSMPVEKNSGHFSFIHSAPLTDNPTTTKDSPMPARLGRASSSTTSFHTDRKIEGARSSPEREGTPDAVVSTPPETPADGSALKADEEVEGARSSPEREGTPDAVVSSPPETPANGSALKADEEVEGARSSPEREGTPDAVVSTPPETPADGSALKADEEVEGARSSPEREGTPDAVVSTPPETPADGSALKADEEVEGARSSPEREGTPDAVVSSPSETPADGSALKADEEVEGARSSPEREGTPDAVVSTPPETPADGSALKADEEVEGARSSPEREGTPDAVVSTPPETPADGSALKADEEVEGARSSPEREGTPDAVVSTPPETPADGSALKADEEAEGARSSPEREGTPDAVVSSPPETPADGSALKADEEAEGARSSPEREGTPDAVVSSPPETPADGSALKTDEEVEGTRSSPEREGTPDAVVSTPPETPADGSALKADEEVEGARSSPEREGTPDAVVSSPPETPADGSALKADEEAEGARSSPEREGTPDAVVSTPPETPADGSALKADEEAEGARSSPEREGTPDAVVSSPPETPANGSALKADEEVEGARSSPEREGTPDAVVSTPPETPADGSALKADEEVEGARSSPEREGTPDAVVSSPPETPADGSGWKADEEVEGARSSPEREGTPDAVVSTPPETPADGSALKADEEVEGARSSPEREGTPDAVVSSPPEATAGYCAWAILEESGDGAQQPVFLSCGTAKSQATTKARTRWDLYERMDAVPVCGETPRPYMRTNLWRHEPFKEFDSRSKSRSPACVAGQLAESYDARIANLQREIEAVRQRRAELDSHRHRPAPKVGKSADTHKRNRKFIEVPKLYDGTALGRSAEPSVCCRSVSSDFLVRGPLEGRRKSDSAALLGGYLGCDAPKVYSFPREKRFLPLVRDGMDFFIDCSVIYVPRSGSSKGDVRKFNTPGPDVCRPVSTCNGCILDHYPNIFLYLPRSCSLAAERAGLHILHIRLKDIFPFLFMYNFSFCIMEEYEGTLAIRLIGWPSLVIACSLFSFLTYCFLSSMLSLPATSSEARSSRTLHDSDEYALFLTLWPGFAAPAVVMELASDEDFLLWDRWYRTERIAFCLIVINKIKQNSDTSGLVALYFIDGTHFRSYFLDYHDADFETLSDVCTTLVVGESEGFLLIPDIVPRLQGALKGDKKSGDLLAMGARALALLVDNFRETIPMMDKTDREAVRWCLKRVYHLVPSVLTTNESKLVFERLTLIDLIEELLKCLSAGQKTPFLESLLPTVEEQLVFCQRAARLSEWVACKGLHHCMLLSRSGKLCREEHVCMLEQMLLEQLQTLATSSKVDYDWDELLRSVTFGLVTLRRQTHNPSNEDKRARKRPREASRGEAQDTFYIALVPLLLHLLVSVGKTCPESRLHLLLACAEAILVYPLEVRIDTETHVEALTFVQSVLRTQTQRSVFFSDPFAKRGSSGDSFRERLDDSSERNSLPSLQWILPSLTFCALELLAKLLGGHPVVEPDYIWAFRGDGDTYFLYRRKHRLLLTQSFLSGSSDVHLPGLKRTVDLIRLTDQVASFGHFVCPVHFQPVPCDQKLKGHMLAVSQRGEQVALGILSSYKSHHELNDVLRILSFGVTPVAQLAKMVHLHLVCCAAPEDCETIRAPFRDLAASGAAAELESVTERLLRRDERWGKVLLNAGVADAMTQATRAPPVRVDSDGKKNNISAVPSKRVSPVMEMLQQTKELMRTAEGLPPLPLTTEGLVRRVGSGDNEALSQFVDLCSTGSLSADVVHSVLEDSARRSALVPLVESWLSRELHTITLEGEKHQLVPTVVQHEAASVFICQNTESGAAARCPNGHALSIYHGVEWVCDACHKQTAYGSYACRVCNYDMCYACLEKSSRCIPVSCTATLADIVSTWRQLRAIDDASGNPSGCGCSFDGVAFDDTGLLPLVVPAHLHPHIHLTQEKEEATVPCRCESTRPTLLYNNHAVSEWTTLAILLDAVGEDLFRELGGPKLGLYGAIENVATSIALCGGAGLPPRLQEILVGLHRCLSSADKKEICHFMAVRCHRYARQCLNNAHVMFPGAVHGEETVGITKTAVSRDNKMSLAASICVTLLKAPPLSHKVEFSFIEEVGTGNGPTQEVYAEFCRLFTESEHFQRVWYQRDDGTCFSASHRFSLGAACGRGFVDDYVIEVPMHPAVWTLVRAGAAVAAPFQQSREEALWELLEVLDETLCRSYRHILSASSAELQDLGLVDEKGEPVTPATAPRYVQWLLLSHFESTLANASYFALGLSTCVDLNLFWFLSNTELNEIFCGAAVEDLSEKLFTEEELRSMVEAAHGYEAGSPIVAQMISIVSNTFSREEQQNFIEFLTGVPRLPVNGLRGLARKITVVKKEMEGDKEETLPSCSTCFLYLKLPPYSSAAVMRQRLLLAVTEGRRNFSLS